MRYRPLIDATKCFNNINTRVSFTAFTGLALRVLYRLPSRFIDWNTIFILLGLSPIQALHNMPWTCSLKRQVTQPKNSAQIYDPRRYVEELFGSHFTTIHSRRLSGSVQCTHSNNNANMVIATIKAITECQLLPAILLSGFFLQKHSSAHLENLLLLKNKCALSFTAHFHGLSLKSKTILPKKFLCS